MSGTGGLVLKFDAPGPVGAAFLADRGSNICGIMGPVGSAKTSCCLMRILYHAIEQKPSPVDGVRYSRFVVIRDTYRRMHQTTLKSWHKRVPRSFGKFSDGGSNAPSVHRLLFKGPGGHTVDCEVIFAAVGDQDVEDFCRGFEVTGAYLNEADLLNPALLQFLPDRCGRYPDMVHGGPTWSGVMADLNAPDTESYIYRDFIENPLEGYKLYVQPSGLDPRAENLPNLPPGYYQRAIRGKADWYIRRMIKNQFGYSRDGKPVYVEYSDHTHCPAEPIEPLDREIILGFDQGLHAGLVILQRSTLGQWRALDELVAPDQGIGATRFGGLVAELIADRYQGLPIRAFGDPAGWSRDNEEQTWMDIVGKVLHLTIKPAPSNDPSMRQEVVRQALLRNVEADMPGLVISPRCKLLRKGFNSGYRYKKRRVAEGYEDAPEKNVFSNVHDGLQYGMLGASGLAAVLSNAGNQQRRRARRQTHAESNYDPYTW